MKNILDYTPLHLDTLILDPPRAGLGTKVLSKVLSLDASRIIYMSCNPKTQKIDLAGLTGDGSYEIKFMKAYDMFPQTPHVETLCVLDRVYQQ
jgi:23S rRNA (uracil1939-C5)-methyltransferase